MNSLEKLIKAEILHSLIDLKRYYLPKDKKLIKSFQNILNKEYTKEDILNYLDHIIICVEDKKEIEKSAVSVKEVPEKIKKILEKIPYTNNLHEWKQKIIFYIVKNNLFKDIAKNTIKKIEPYNYIMVEYNSLYPLPTEISSMLPDTDKIRIWHLDDVIEQILCGFDKDYIEHVKYCFDGLNYSDKKKKELKRRINILREKHSYPQNLKDLIKLGLKNKNSIIQLNKTYHLLSPQHNRQEEPLHYGQEVLDYKEATKRGYLLPDRYSILVVSDNEIINIYRTKRRGKRVIISRVYDANPKLHGVLRKIEKKASEIHKLPFNIGHFYIQ